MLEEFDHFFNDSRQQKRLTFLMESFEHIPYNRQKDAIKEIVSVAKQVNYDWCDMFGLGDTGLKYFTKDSSVFTEFVQYLDPDDLAIYNEYRENALSSLRAKENMIDNDQLSINEYFSDIHNSIVGGVPTYASEQITTESVVNDSMVKVDKLPDYLYFGYYDDEALFIDNYSNTITIPPEGLPVSKYKAIASIFGIDHTKITKKLSDHFAIFKYNVEEWLKDEDRYIDRLNSLQRPIYATVYHTGRKRKTIHLVNNYATMYDISTRFNENLKGNVYLNTMSPLQTMYISKDVGEVYYNTLLDFNAEMIVTYRKFKEGKKR